MRVRSAYAAIAVATTTAIGDAALIDVVNAAGTRLSDGGQVAFGASFFDNRCRRTCDLQYDTNAPFASLSLAFDKLTLDGSIRYDFGDASGRTLGADLGVAASA